jgi:tRNA(adenine34) deaminase
VRREAHHYDRRTVISAAVALFFATCTSAGRAQGHKVEPERRWFEAAAEMKRLAESWGDQPYGAVLVLNGALMGEGPSRVVKNQNPDAHAEREAIRDAQRKLGREMLDGAILYSTSRPCRACEAAAARARVSRMYFGSTLSDAGVPSLAAR